jgi:hypothetical protein
VQLIDEEATCDPLLYTYSVTLCGLNY